nr:putative ribonuclease H-like domain-containing protein [Tanacetum cinerariifolium]
MSHLEFMDVEIEQDDLNQKFLTSLALEWLMYTNVWRNRDDVYIISLDDVYNHLKVYEPKVQKKSESNSQNMAFISLSNTSSGKGEVHTASVPTASTQVSTASTDVAAASISHDTVCTYIASQSNDSQIKYKDITQIDEDDIKEMEIKWNMALLSMRADRFWKKTGKKITIQGSDIAGFDKSNVECFNFYKIRHFARECRAPRSQDIENHALVADDEVPTKFALMAKSSSSSENELERVKKEKEGLDNKLTGFEYALKDLDTLLGSQRTDKNKEGLGYSDVSPLLLKPTSSIDSTKSNTSDLQNNNFSVFEQGESSSSIMSRPMIKFVKAADCPGVIKTNKTETARKSPIKYVEMYRNTSKSCKVREKGKNWPKNNFAHKNLTPIAVLLKTGRNPIAVNRANMNVAQPKITSFAKTAHSNVRRPFQGKSPVRTQSRVPRVSTADLGNKGKAVKASAYWICRPKQNTTEKASVDESMLWHRRLGHLNFKTMNKLVRNNIVKGLSSKCFENDHTCVACLKGKQHKAYCKTKLVNFVSKPLHTLHMDLFGPTSVSSLNHKWYCLVVTEDFSRFTWTFFLRTKDETSGILRNFITEIENLKDLKVKIIRPLGKFDAKGDEGYFVGYSMFSKAFRVFNKITKKVEEILPVDFLENKLIVKGAGPNWLFDIDTLTNSMNYVPVVVAGTSSINILGTKDVASQAVKKDMSSLRYIALPNWFHEAHMESSNSNAQDACNVDAPESSGISNPTATSKSPPAEQMESLTVESEFPTDSLPVLTVFLDISPETSSG